MSPATVAALTPEKVPSAKPTSTPSPSRRSPGCAPGLGASSDGELREDERYREEDHTSSFQHDGLPSGVWVEISRLAPGVGYVACSPLQAAGNARGDPSDRAHAPEGSERAALDERGLALGSEELRE